MKTAQILIIIFALGMIIGAYANNDNMIGVSFIGFLITGWFIAMAWLVKN